MKNFTPIKFPFAKAYCNVFGHKLKVSKNVTNHIHEYKCANCGVEMTDTANGFLARLTPRFKETNDYLAKIHQRRKERIYVSAS
ncbi:MAG TPA: hypothetical protein VK941_07980 [Gillisia sp.]|nr:hypothetical protein [Gillisia sp.]